MTAGDGAARRDAALRGIERQRGELVQAARAALLTELLERGVATIDAVRRRVPLPDGANTKAFGTTPGELVRLGLIEADGRYEPSTRPEAHARPVRRWRLRDRAGALAWLKAHGPPDERAAAGRDGPGAAVAETLDAPKCTAPPADAALSLLFDIREARPCQWDS